MKKYIIQLAVVAGLLLSQATSGYSHTSHGGALSNLESSLLLPFNGGATTDSTLFQHFLSHNRRYRDDDSVLFKGLKKRFKETATEQHPKAFVLDCIDSRVIPELCFQQNIGETFTGRAAGNMMDGDITGSLSYAINFKHVTCIVVLGHSNCGAVMSAIDYYNGKFDSVTAGPQLTALIRRLSTNSVGPVRNGDRGRRYFPYDASNPEFVNAVVIANVKWTSDRIKRTFNNKPINVFGAFYDTSNGEVTQTP